MGSGSDISRSEEKSGIRFVNFFENSVIPGFLAWINQRFQEPLKAEFKRFRNVKEVNLIKSVSENTDTFHDLQEKDKEKSIEQQLQAWRDNPSWIDQPPKVKVKTENGSLCHLNVEVNVGLPPESVYEIFTHPDNKRYFRNIKENISRKVLKEDGPIQIIEVEQAAAWKFLWLSGTFPIHLIVHENRKHLKSDYKQEKTIFMKVFEGCWKVEPLLIDEELCERLKPKTIEEYKRCSGGRGRIASKVTMDQSFQPSAMLTPPPLSWYVRGITVKTTESMIEDLLAEAAKIRGGGGGTDRGENDVVLGKRNEEEEVMEVGIKERWRLRRKGKRSEMRRIEK